MTRLTEQQTKQFFGDFDVNENAKKLVMIDGKRYANLIEACRVVFDNTIAEEVNQVINALGLEKLAWSTIARGDYVTASACLYNTTSTFELKISQEGLGTVYGWDYNEGADNMVTPLLKDMGYVSTPPPIMPLREHKPKSAVGYKVRKLINGYNVEFTACKQTN